MINSIDNFNLTVVSIDDFFLEICPRDILINEIISRINFTDFQNFGRVSKGLIALITDDVVLRDVIYKIAIFNPVDWDVYLDYKIANAQKMGNTLAGNIGAIFKSPSPIRPGKKFGETHRFLYMPKEMSINIFGKIKEYERINPLFELIHGDLLSINEGYIAVPIRYSPETGSKYFVDKTTILGDFQFSALPKAIEAVISIATTYLKFGIKVMDGPRCSDAVDKFQFIKVGYYGQGIRVEQEWFDENFED